MLELEWRPPRVQSALTDDPFHVWQFPDGTPWTQFHRTEEGYILRFPELADFGITHNGEHIYVWPVPDVQRSTVLHLLDNQVRPLVLGKLGQLVFHASAVEIRGRAAVFVAESGRGKSTLAASFALDGWGFLTDDGLSVRREDNTFLAEPGPQSLRLWHDSDKALIPEAAIRTSTLPFTTKAKILAADHIKCSSQPCPVKNAYFLGDGSCSRIEIKSLTAADATIEWIKHAFILDIEDRDYLASHFDQVAELASGISHYLLDFPRDYSILKTVRDAIIDHMKEGEHR